MTSTLLYDQGPAASRPAAGIKGRIYNPTDESGVFYKDDGATWVRVPIHPYVREVLADSPVAYWRLGESSGTTVVDEMGAHDGVYEGAPQLGVPGLLSDGTAVRWTPDTDKRARITSLSFSTFTATGLVYPHTLPTGQHYLLHSSRADGTDEYFEVNQEGGLLFFRFWIGTTNGERNRVETSISANQRYHWAVTWNGSNELKFYVNGTLIGTGTTSITWPVASRNVSMGNNSQASMTPGTTPDATEDEVAFYDQVLPEGRIQAQYGAVA